MASKEPFTPVAAARRRDSFAAAIHRPEEDPKPLKYSEGRRRLSSPPPPSRPPPPGLFDGALSVESQSPRRPESSPLRGARQDGHTQAMRAREVLGVLQSVQVLCDQAAKEVIHAEDGYNSGALGSLHASGIILGQTLAQLSQVGSTGGDAEMHAALSNILLLVKAAEEQGGGPGETSSSSSSPSASAAASSPALVASAGAVAILSRAAEERLVADLREMEEAERSPPLPSHDHAEEHGEDALCTPSPSSSDRHHDDPRAT